MDSDSSCLATVVLDTGALASQAGAIERFTLRRLGRLVCRAKRLIQRYHLADPAFDADDAVQDALL
jgi:hypothetical protein